MAKKKKDVAFVVLSDGVPRIICSVRLSASGPQVFPVITSFGMLPCAEDRMLRHSLTRPSGFQKFSVHENLHNDRSVITYGFDGLPTSNRCYTDALKNPGKFALIYYQALPDISDPRHLWKKSSAHQTIPCGALAPASQRLHVVVTASNIGTKLCAKRAASALGDAVSIADFTLSSTTISLVAVRSLAPTTPQGLLGSGQQSEANSYDEDDIYAFLRDSSVDSDRILRLSRVFGAWGRDTKR